jgi:hypothetical protein
VGYLLDAVLAFFRAARRGFADDSWPFATVPVAVFESPAFARSCAAISAISSGA